MYRIQGGDGKEYGPASAEQVRAWIREGRANAQTRLRAEDSADWRALGELPEFAAELGRATGAPQGTPPPISGGVAVVDIDALAAEVLARQPRVAISHCLSRSWALLTQRFWLAVGVCFIGSLVEQVPFIIGVMHAGLFWFFLKRIRGEEARFEDAFAGFSVAFVPTLLGGIVVALLVSLGMAFCVVPGLILMTVWSFTWPLMIDRRLDFWPAMELSRKVLWPNFWGMFGLWVMSFLVLSLGVLCCGVGVFVAMPVVIGAQAYAYEDFFGLKRT